MSTEPAPKKTASNVVSLSAAAAAKEDRTWNEIITGATDTYIRRVLALPVKDRPSPQDMERSVLHATNLVIAAENQLRDKSNRMTALRTLTHAQVAKLLIAFEIFVKIAPSGKNSDPDYDLVGGYCASGEDEGIYLTSEDQLRRVARGYSASITTNDWREILSVLRESAPRVHRCSDRDLIAVNNGVFHYGRKELLPFSPEYVFVAKSRVNYVADAESPEITMPDGQVWELEQWMADLHDNDPATTELLWEITGAVVRPHVRWNKSAWLHSDRGNNGKGSLVELMRNLCGAASHVSIPLTELGKDFMLEPLTRASAIIVDENDVGTFIDKAANLKALITNDVLMINRKNKVPISYQFWGFMVQCLNEFPRIKDKSDSFYRRQTFIHFPKSFTGVERRYIKDDYLSRPEVLEYALKRVLHMDYYELSTPDATAQILEEFKIHNDPVRQFWAEHRDQFVWDRLPPQFVYDLYRAWFEDANPSGYATGKNTMIAELRAIVETDPDWTVHPAATVRCPMGEAGVPEPMIQNYRLARWYHQDFVSSTRTGYEPTPDKWRRICSAQAVTASKVFVRKRDLTANNND